MNWNPIYTAPQNGLFLVHIPEVGMVKAFRRGNGFANGDTGKDIDEAPTHWMEYPSPPVDYSVVVWNPIFTAPKDRRILVISSMGTMHTAEWSKNPITDDEAWRIAVIDDEGTCLIMHDATWWMELPEKPV